jgi:hypothetical protein
VKHITKSLTLSLPGADFLLPNLDGRGAGGVRAGERAARPGRPQQSRPSARVRWFASAPPRFAGAPPRFAGAPPRFAGAPPRFASAAPVRQCSDGAGRNRTARNRQDGLSARLALRASRPAVQMFTMCQTGHECADPSARTWVIAEHKRNAVGKHAKTADSSTAMSEITALSATGRPGTSRHDGTCNLRRGHGSRRVPCRCLHPSRNPRHAPASPAAGFP